jgi:hypothetical protein
MLKLSPILAALGLAAALPGCGAGAAAIVYDGSRNAAERVIGADLADQMPGIDPAAGAECILRGMRPAEIVALGSGDSTRVTPAYRAKIDEAMARPEVAACLAAVPVRAG